MKGRPFINLSGQQFWWLSVIGRMGTTGARQTLWRCRCACGRITAVAGHHLRSGRTKSCGCMRGQPTRLSA